MRLPTRVADPPAAARVGAGDPRTLSSALRRTPVAPSGHTGPPNDVANSTLSEPGDVPAGRVPAYGRTLCHGSEVSDLGPAPHGGGDQPGSLLVSPRGRGVGRRTLRRRNTQN
ncbi:hypothetical protein EASAB2608_02349 [Streptomyces sp. EAS-AB2608]|nr:hypothetical protein EASAB2608_02349 [Streptomyces sp. EAS-AB2608]